MKQPDTAALRERLANYTPGQEREQDEHELDELLQEVNCQIVELRNLLKSINALKEELHDIHSSLKHTAQRERSAFNALLAAKDSADNIIKVEQNTVIHAKISPEELEKVNRCSATHIKAEEELLERHRNMLAKHLRNNEGIWLSNRWLIFMIITQTLCFLVIILWSYLK